MQEEMTKIIKNSQGQTVGAVVETELGKLGYDREKIVNYSFLIEEALIEWREKLPADSDLIIKRVDKGSNVYFSVSIEGEKVDPFYIDPSEMDDLSVMKYHDKLLSGVGSELRYKYSKGSNVLSIVFPKTNINERLFRRDLILLALPLLFGTLMNNIAANVDAIMLGFMSSDAMSAVSLVSKYTGLFTWSMVALTTVTMTLIAQYFGKRERNSINQIAGIALEVVIAIAILFTLGAVFVPDVIMRFFTDVESVRAQGILYLRAYSPYYIFTAVYLIFYSFLRSTGQSKKSVIYSVIGCIVSVVLNAVFVFGIFGIPQLGVIGSGIAASAGSGVQLVLVLIDYFKHRTITVRFFSAKKGMFKEYITIAVPAVAEILVCSGSLAVVSAAFGHLGADALAANSAILIVSNIVLSVRPAYANAAGILIGDALGKGKVEEAKYKATLAIKMSFCVAAGAAALVLGVGFGLRFTSMDLSSGAISCMNILMCMEALMAFTSCVSNEVVFGELYAGGDTVACLVVELIVMVGIMIPIALLGTYVFHWPIVLMMILLKLDEPLKFPLYYGRYRQMKWARSLVKK